MITIALVIAIVGLILYLLPISPNRGEQTGPITPKINRVGEIMFFAGLLAVLLGSLGAKVLA